MADSQAVFGRVSVSMADSRERFKDPVEIERALAENRRVREETKAELDAVQEVLRALLLRGRAAGLSVTGMARAAGISRDTAHRLIREAKPPRKR